MGLLSTCLRPGVAVAALGAGVALLAVGCGSGPAALGESKDAKVAARSVADALRSTTKGVRSVTCGPLDFAVTYRCTAEVKGTDGLVCSLAGGGGVASPAKGSPAPRAPFCLSAAKDRTEQRRRNEIAVNGLGRLNAELRLRKIVTGLRKGGFTLGCVVGFRTVQGGTAQTGDIVLEVLAVQTDSGRAFWTALTVSYGFGAKTREKTGVDPADKPPLNPYSACRFDEGGAAALTGEPRDVALLAGSAPVGGDGPSTAR